MKRFFALLFLPCLALAQTKISDLTAFTTPAAGDLFMAVDVSDTAQGAAGSTRKITWANLFKSPTLITPVLGVATATSVNKITITAPATGATITLLDGKTFTVNNTLTLAGTDGTTITFPGTSATLARIDAANTFTGASTASAWVMTSPTITTKISPTTDDGAPLGDTTHNWSDLFLASGSVINWNNGDLLLTHTANLLTLTGGNLTVPTLTATTLAGAGGAITLVASGFDGNLATTDDTLQEVAQKLDDLATGAATTWTNIGDASADTGIALAGFETDFTSTLDSSGKAIITITNTDADTAADTSFLDLRHNDGADANVFYARFIGDNDGTPTNDYLFSQALFSINVPTTFGAVAVDLSAATLTLPPITLGTFVEGAAASTPASGQVAVYAKADGLIYGKDDAGTETVLSGGGSATAFDVIGDPSGDGTIAFVNTKQLITSTLDNGIVLELSDTDADAASDTTLLKLSHNDGADANVIYLLLQGDKDGTPTSDLLISQTGITSLLGYTGTTGVFGSTTSLLLGTAGSAVGNIGFRNATSGTATLAPPTGALGTYAVTLPNAASTLPIFGQQITFTGPTAARSIALPDAAFTVARTDAANTFTGVQSMTSPDFTTSVTTGSTSFTAYAGATTLLTFGGTGASASNFFPSTLDTTSSTTGAIRTSGGISAAKALNIGATGTFGATTSLLLGTAGSAVGNIGFRNATSGTITVAPVTGALGTVTLSLPAATDTLVGKATTDVLTNKTYDTADTGNVFKQKGYIYLTHPHLADGTNATIGTTATAIGYGHATFSNSVDQASNYVEYYIQVPEDIDTSVALRGRIKVLLGNTDTAAQRYVLSSVSVADSAVPTASTLANAINVDFAGDASGANGDVETSAWTTLTSWAGALTAGQTWRIRFARDGDTSDASTVNSTELGVVIEYGITQ